MRRFCSSFSRFLEVRLGDFGNPASDIGSAAVACATGGAAPVCQALLAPTSPGNAAGDGLRRTGPAAQARPRGPRLPEWLRLSAQSPLHQCWLPLWRMLLRWRGATCCSPRGQRRHHRRPRGGRCRVLWWRTPPLSEGAEWSLPSPRSSRRRCKFSLSDDIVDWSSLEFVLDWQRFSRHWSSLRPLPQWIRLLTNGPVALNSLRLARRPLPKEFGRRALDGVKVGHPERGVAGRRRLPVHRRARIRWRRMLNPFGRVLHWFTQRCAPSSKMAESVVAEASHEERNSTRETGAACGGPVALHWRS